MPDLQQHPQFTMPVSMPVVTPTERPVAVQVRICGRWVAGQALSRRTAPTGTREVLISHHGHVVWVDQQLVRELV